METLGELKVIIGRASNVHVNYYATSGKNKFYFSDVPDVDGCDMFIVGEGGNLIETDMDSVCIYGFDTFRSLSDIKQIIKLMECLESIGQTTKGGDVLGCWDMMKIKECLKWKPTFGTNQK